MKVLERSTRKIETTLLEFEKFLLAFSIDDGGSLNSFDYSLFEKEVAYACAKKNNKELTAQNILDNVIGMDGNPNIYYQKDADISHYTNFNGSIIKSTELSRQGLEELIVCLEDENYDSIYAYRHVDNGRVLERVYYSYKTKKYLPTKAKVDLSTGFLFPDGYTLTEDNLPILVKNLNKNKLVTSVSSQRSSVDFRIKLDHLFFNSFGKYDPAKNDTFDKLTLGKLLEYAKIKAR